MYRSMIMIMMMIMMITTCPSLVGLDRPSARTSFSLGDVPGASCLALRLGRAGFGCHGGQSLKAGKGVQAHRSAAAADRAGHAVWHTLLG